LAKVKNSRIAIIHQLNLLKITMNLTKFTPNIPQELGQIADKISSSILYTLERQYLENSSQIKLLSPNPNPEPYHFWQLEQVGNNPPEQTLIAVQNALAACHEPHKYTLIFAVVSDGITNKIYLGMRGYSSLDRPVNRLNYLNNFLKANCQGIKLKPCSSEIIQRQIEMPLSNSKSAIALTGIPSLKIKQTHAQNQSIDRLLRGLTGQAFCYLIIAEPINNHEVEKMNYRCRDLLGRVHTLTKTTFNASESEGISNNKSQVNPNLINFFPPLGLLATLSGSNMAEQTSDSTGINNNMTKALGREQLNVHAQLAETYLQRYMTRFEQAKNIGCWNVGIYFIAENDDIATQGGYQLKALLSGENSTFEPIRIHKLSQWWAQGVQSALSQFQQPVITLENQNKQTIQHPLSDCFNGLTTPINTEELSLLINFPQREIAGVQMINTADFSLNPPILNNNDLRLGHLLEGGEITNLPYGLSLATLAKHTLITGITGSGKSTTTRKIIQEMYRLKIPFLVIEPAKTEYVQWAREQNQKLAADDPNRITIYMPGVNNFQGENIANLTLNPFDLVRLNSETIPQVLPHSDRLKSILNASFPMQEILPVLLEELIFHVYTRPFNWLENTEIPINTPCPTLTQLLDQIHPVIKGKGYAPEITNNLSAALTTRIQSLRRGWKKQLFDQPYSTPWSELFDRPVIINLSYLGDDADKALTMAILLQFLYEYRQSQQSIKPTLNNSLNHLTIIEEAHRILIKNSGYSLEQANPQAKVAEMFSNMISEIRAYGQGILLVDQVPSRLVADAIKNTNLKIVHRLVAEDDRHAMSSCMNLTAEQAKILNLLRPGQAIVFGDLEDQASWLKISP
jgi:Helicase HerA, central domain